MNTTSNGPDPTDQPTTTGSRPTSSGATTSSRTGAAGVSHGVAGSANEAIRSGMSALAGVGRHRHYSLAIGIILIVAFAIWAINDGGSDLFFQRVFDGLSNGFIYSAMALALVLIFKATGVVNFAQGEMAMLGAFSAYAIANAFDIPGFVAVLIAMALSAIVAAGIERVLIRPFDPSNHLAIVIVTLSLFLMLNAIAGVIWAFDGRAFPSLFPGRNKSFQILGANIEYADLFTWITVLVAVLLVTLLLRKTKIGLAFRAVSSSLESSELLGIHIGRTLQFGWALAAAIGTLAGSLVARTTLLEPNFMGRVLIYSSAAATLGGLDSLGGAVIAGIIIGLVQTMGGGYIDAIGSELAPAVALVVIVLILMVKPSGLFGSKRIERV
jgi:branched-chain amino acid transport system permease protein